jgi:DNA-binding HxlR family transcriptional regulator
VGASYYQFCPVAKAMELLDERWTMLIVRELVSGSERFTELRRGLPHISPTLLSARLAQLTRTGIVTKSPDGRYVLTPAGRELRPVVEALGTWGIRWMGELAESDLDPKLLMWDIRRRIDHTQVPDVRTVVAFRFADVAARARDWWLVITPDTADVCDHDPGFPVDVTVRGSVRTLIAVWMGELSWPAALRGGGLEITGAAALRRALPRWLALSTFAEVPRVAPAAR